MRLNKGLDQSVDVCRLPTSRYTGPIIDAHCHGGRSRATRRMIRAGELFGIRKWVLICRVDEIAALRRRHGDRVAFNAWSEHELVGRDQPFTDANLRIVERAVRAGAVSIKFWYKPEFNERSGVWFDDPRLDPVFDAIQQSGLSVLVHIADPDIWWRHRYSDPLRFESKRLTYRQLTNTLERFPSLRVLLAHMGGWPENLSFLAELLDRHPNLYLDTSGTKWIARELSRRPAESRDFFVRYADRLLFGSDLVAFKHATFEHHCSRYWAHRFLYERSDTVRSPIEDEDAGGRVFLAGMNLPDAVLDRLYYANAASFFRLGG
ncbi:MAG TPA: amidohydrolase family protein [Phycisphaerae bacterium]|nr:amidohydrolase family protein [Phycisphaerae bacterium]HRR86126.1 amidohydrolase family protein [Phycisphaerae bacterium]